MLVRVVIAAALFALAGCGPSGGGADTDSDGAAKLEAPAPESEPARAFTPAGAAATRATGPLTVSVAQNFPDADSAEHGAGPREVLKLAGANNYRLEAELVGASSPATLVEGQTVRGAMGLPVEATTVLIYRVMNETKSGGAGLCGAPTAGYVLEWEPESVGGEPVFKLMGLLGGAPGDQGVRLCPALDYRRS
jgi:hypothetical protein